MTKYFEHDSEVSSSVKGGNLVVQLKDKIRNSLNHSKDTSRFINITDFNTHVLVYMIFILILRTYAQKFSLCFALLVSVNLKSGRLLPENRMNAVSYVQN